MGSSSGLMIIALMVSLSFAIPHRMDERSNVMPSKMLTNDEMEFRMEGLKKMSRRQSTDARTYDELANRVTIDEIEDDEVPSPIDPIIHEIHGKMQKKSRKHKAFFINYPFVPQLRRYHNSPNYGTTMKNRNDVIDEPKSGHKKRIQQPDSQIYYIKLPPTPYMFVPGLGYISQPPTYSTASLQTPQHHHHHQRPTRPHGGNHKPTGKPFINVPIDFVSNGKPTGVYQWSGSKRPETSLNSLNEGPYVFNGRPNSLYLLGPDGQQTGHQPIRLADYSAKERY